MDSQYATSLRSFDNSWYRPGNILKRCCWMVVSSLFFRHSLALPGFLKCGLLRVFGASVGRNVHIKPSVNIKYPWFLTVGDDCWIGEEVWIDNLAPVTIGNNVCISQGAYLLTGNHDYKKPGFDLMIGPIVLEDGSWVGAKAIVCPGVRCQSHSVLTVNSVATKDLLPYSIYQGNPAVFIKERKMQGKHADSEAV